MLDLSAAFDTVDHTTLLRRLEHSYGIRGTALSWVRSYLSGRAQHVRSGSTRSRPTVLRYVVYQGSILGPILFLLYTADLTDLVTKHGLSSHLYADDTTVCGTCPPAMRVDLSPRLGGHTVANQPSPHYCPPLIHLHSPPPERCIRSHSRCRIVMN